MKLTKHQAEVLEKLPEVWFAACEGPGELIFISRLKYTCSILYAKGYLDCKAGNGEFMTNVLLYKRKK